MFKTTPAIQLLGTQGLSLSTPNFAGRFYDPVTSSAYNALLVGNTAPDRLALAHYAHAFSNLLGVRGKVAKILASNASN